MTATLGRSILRDPAFGRLWFIQASTQVGGNMSLYALTILVFATTRSNAAVSALVLSFLVPTILLSAVAGVLVDRLDVRWAMIGPNAIRTTLTFGLAVAGANVAILLLLNLGISLTSVVLTPAEASREPGPPGCTFALRALVVSDGSHPISSSRPTAISRSALLTCMM